jgi:hypothetical protein
LCVDRHSLRETGASLRQLASIGSLIMSRRSRGSTVRVSRGARLVEPFEAAWTGWRPALFGRAALLPLLDDLHARPVTGKRGHPRHKPDAVIADRG